MVEAAGDKQASDILILDVRGVCSFADYFVLCSGESERQIRSIEEEIIKVLKQDGISPHHHEGTAESGWLLIDYGDVIVHIFDVSERERYQLDRLWENAPAVLRIQ